MGSLGKWAVVCVICAGFALIIGDSFTASAKGKGKPKDKTKQELKVKIGAAVPAFEGTDDAGKPFKSSDVIGKKIVVLYFYPADFTANAVAQARSYQDEMENLTARGAVVIGISGDSVSTHKLFKSYYKLPFTLLADEKGEVAKLFGVPSGEGGKSPTINAKEEKGSVNRSATIERWTLVIDMAGKLAAADKVGEKDSKVADDAKRVAQTLKKLDTK